MCTQALRDAIFSVVDSLAVTLDVGGVFKGVPAGPSYALRTVVCYFGHHYQVQPPCTTSSLLLFNIHWHICIVAYHTCHI